MMNEQEIIEAVEATRTNELVGRGTCSIVDNCLTDSELAEHFKLRGFSTVKEAVEWCVDYEESSLEQALNSRWGEDSDPELIAWRNWQARKEEAGL